MIKPEDTISFRNYGNGGRLGNQLFSVAACLGLSEKYGCRYELPPWNYWQYFKNNLSVTTGELFSVTHIYHEPYFHYTGIVPEDIVELSPVTERNIELRGYFQSEKYWIESKEKILTTFEFKDDVVRKARLWLNKISELEGGATSFTSIHMRFGDYSENPYYADLYANKYYEKAVCHITATAGKSIYIVFSDDPAKARQKMQQSDILSGLIYYIIDPAGSDIDDMCMQSLCTNNICANSSYSWWSSYLNRNKNKIVTMPQQWFAGSGLPNDTKDLYPSWAMKL